MKVVILTDYRNQLWLKTDYKEQSVDTRFLAQCFEDLDCEVKITRFADVDLRKDNYAGTLVVYQSSEDPDLFYKSYIEDKLLALELAGATLVPPFPCFRAHHNKVFMELLRDLSPFEEIKTPRAYGFGTLEEFDHSKHDKNGTFVCKLAEGAQSKNVRLAHNLSEQRRILRQMSASFHWYYWLVDMIKPLRKRRYPNYRRKSHNRRKFIVQEFVEDLKSDFKILVYGNKFYVLEREVPKYDFRASGSGMFSYPEQGLGALLDFARKVFHSFNVPFLSIDVARRNEQCKLLEFQFVSFGTYTLEKAPHYFLWEGDRHEWTKITESSCLEKEVASAIVAYANEGAHFKSLFHPPITKV